MIFRTNIKFSPIHLSAAFPNELSFPSSESLHARCSSKKEQASREKYWRQKFWNELGSLPLPLFLLESQVESEDGHPGCEEEGEEGEEDHHQHHPRHPATKEIRRNWLKENTDAEARKAIVQTAASTPRKAASKERKTNKVVGLLCSQVNIVPTSGPRNTPKICLQGCPIKMGGMVGH